jgi:hypothetical protein
MRPEKPQVWHDKDPSLLKGPERRDLQPFTANGDVSLQVKYS